MNQTDAAPPELLPAHTVFIDSDWLTVGIQQGRALKAVSIYP